MSLPLFTDSLHCKSGVHCVTCRNRGAAGESFRANSASRFVMPKGECPHGVPWGYTGGVVDRAPDLHKGPGEMVERILKWLGYKKKMGCGCDAMRRAMNIWGWRGCWRNRDFINKWFLVKAKEAGMDLDLVRLWRFITTGGADE